MFLRRAERVARLQHASTKGLPPIPPCSVSNARKNNTSMARSQTSQQANLRSEVLDRKRDRPSLGMCRNDDGMKASARIALPDTSRKLDCNIICRHLRDERPALLSFSSIRQQCGLQPSYWAPLPLFLLLQLRTLPLHIDSLL